MNTITSALIIQQWTIIYNPVFHMKLTGLLKILTLILLYLIILLIQQTTATATATPTVAVLSSDIIDTDTDTDIPELHMTTTTTTKYNNNNNNNNNNNEEISELNSEYNYCAVVINNRTVFKELHSKWILNDEPCLIHSCSLQANTEQPREIIIHENCTNFICDPNSELRPKNGSCCGECIPMKCLHNGISYNIGQTWYDEDDNCTLYECANDLDNNNNNNNNNNGLSSIPEVNSYQKYCSPLTKDCPRERIYTHDCCEYCNETDNNNNNNNNHYNNNYSNDNKELNHFKYITVNDDIWTKEFYRQHVCARECREDETAKTCVYKFVVEWYETLSKACYNCPHNISDCYRPHCIAGDGIERAITVVNRMMPGPEIHVCQNDIVQVDVENALLGDSTTIHWHGMHMKENPYMDGVPHITQCPISPHATFRYVFRAENSGTHFWHSHTGMQRGDGVYGAFIVKRPRSRDPHANLYDFDLSEHIMILQDWVHVPGVSLFTSHHHSRGDNKPVNLLVNGKGRYYPGIWEEIKRQESLENVSQDSETSKSNSNSNNRSLGNNIVLSPPIPISLSRNKSLKMPVQDNEVLRRKLEDKAKRVIKRDIKSNFKNISALPLEIFHVRPGYRYRFRIINAEFLNCPIQVSIDNHTLLAINSDGYDLEAADVGSIVTYAGERFDFILHTNQVVENYWIRFKGLMDCDERFTSAFQVAILHYEGANRKDEPSASSLGYNYQPDGITLNALNRGSGHVDSLTIAEVNSLPINDHLSGVEHSILESLPDYKFFIYYDFYRKDNPTFHPSQYYGIEADLDAANRLFTPQLNHISLKVPSTALLPARHYVDENLFCNETSLEENGIDCRQEFCNCLHVLQIPLNSIVEMILVDEGFTYDANHPFHLHGNAFRVLAIEKLGDNVTVEKVKELERNNQLKRNLDQPPVKDTVTVPDGGYTIIRFKATNPGFWLFHCHIEFHAEIGMAFVFKVGNNDEMPPTPKNFPSCYDYNIMENNDYTNNNEVSRGIINCYKLSKILKVLLFVNFLKIFYT